MKITITITDYELDMLKRALRIRRQDWTPSPDSLPIPIGGYVMSIMQARIALDLSTAKDDMCCD
jgi:hypothetical protein